MYSAHDYHKRFVSGDLTAVEIVTRTLKKAEKHNQTLNAFLSLFNERALEKAKLLDQKRKNNHPLGKLAGVPIAIKDNIHIKGELTTCASKFLSNYRALFDATMIRHLEEEDALLIGKTNLDEFAMGGSGIHSAYGLTRNPWNLNCSPGGSSSGSSAAVSARICPVAFGSDTGGSIRQPAAFTGITGFKPTYGRISRYGLVAFGSSLDQIGPMTTSVKDAALLMEVVGKHCKHDSTSLPLPTPHFTKELEKPIAGRTLGVPWSFLESLGGEVRKNFENAIRIYQDLGVKIVDIDLSILKYSIAVYYILATAEASTNLARFDGIRYGVRSKTAKNLEEVYDYSREEGFGPEVKSRILLGTFVLSGGYHDAYYTKGQQVRSLIMKQMRHAFEKCDLIALPPAPTAAFELGGISDPLEEYLQDLYTVAANLAGIPAISIPTGFTTDGKPLGIQLMGPQTKDARVLRFAHAFQTGTDFASAIPPGYEDSR